MTAITEENHNYGLPGDVSTEEQEDGTVELRVRMKPEQLTRLSRIFFAADYKSLEQVEAEVYAFGRSLRTKDLFARGIFVCMASMLRKRRLGTAG